MRTSRQCFGGFVCAFVVSCLAAASCVEPPPGSTAEQEALDVCAIANDGDLCDDHQACTYPDVCMNKKCVGMAVLDGTRCTDGNVCTTNDHCAAGVCVATVESDGTPCTPTAIPVPTPTFASKASVSRAGRWSATTAMTARSTVASRASAACSRLATADCRRTQDRVPMR